MKKDNSETYPLLSKIDSPADLKRLPIDALPDVCLELRSFIIDSLSKNPGHFASNLGTVELTVALHYVFNTPEDRIVWDVGHQAYGHKILTGRRDSFHTNRKYKGLSGFPNPEESVYDSFVAGHASNSISAALGMSIASQIEEEGNRKVVAVIGDASIAGGLAFEGLNNAASTKNDLLIILNDNDMSIDRNVGSLNKYLVNINTSKSYNTLRYKAYNVLHKMHLITEKHRGIILRFNNSLKSLITRQQNIFEGLNIRYFGPYDGHDVIRLVRVLSDIRDMEGPRILHLRTVKGKGYPAAERMPSVWHAPGLFNKETGEIIKSNTGDKRLKYQDVFGKTLVELAEKDKRVVGITAAMPTGCSMTYMQERFPKRTFDVGISEGHAVTFSGGLAKDGVRPFCCIYSTFLQRAYDQMIHDVALQHLPVTFCLDRAGIVGEDGATHHGAFDLAYLRTIPNMIVAAPMDEHDLRNLMFTSLKQDYPFAIRYPRGKCEHEDWQSPMVELPVGKGRKLKDGTMLAVLSIGTIGNIAQKAINDAEAEANVSVAHYDMIYAKPLDAELLQEVGSKFKTVITIEDGVKSGGMGTAVTEWFNDNGFAVRTVRMGMPDRFVKQGSVAELYKECGMDSESIKNEIIRLIKNSKQ